MLAILKYKKNAIAQHIDYVIGMNQAIGDRAALEFSVGFYDALARYEEQTSPLRGEGSRISPPSLVGKGVGGLGSSFAEKQTSPPTPPLRGEGSKISSASLSSPPSLVGKGVGGLGFLHTRLLNAYTQKYPNGWHSLENDGYIFQNLAHHLIQAGRTTELQQLLLDFRWLQAKLENSNINRHLLENNVETRNFALQGLWITHI
ncbi:hypothetical protein OGM63_18390 [Plectonema radiosum NIES-515]|uniref:APAF-1 helical domain-containing protein n=1 Tax=Plectonema radiosum NIES-515 TaxID=2986073 RepID=A0ABT3B273_9CYAN|nr:hypothetical protein [Plectonema radiosum]MCV3215458.1 hypothetical protein [Plectonema radiosum NIES-515]